MDVSNDIKMLTKRRASVNEKVCFSGIAALTQFDGSAVTIIGADLDTLRTTWTRLHPEHPLDESKCHHLAVFQVSDVRFQ